MSFDTPLSLAGPLRKPLQMLADQEYGGHSSIHDDAMAEKLGFRAGPIEGPTHFSQFQPLLAKICSGLRSGPARLRGVSKLMGRPPCGGGALRRSASYRATPPHLKQPFEMRQRPGP